MANTDFSFDSSAFNQNPYDIYNSPYQNDVADVSTPQTTETTSYTAPDYSKEVNGLDYPTTALNTKEQQITEQNRLPDAQYQALRDYVDTQKILADAPSNAEAKNDVTGLNQDTIYRAPLSGFSYSKPEHQSAWGDAFRAFSGYVGAYLKHGNAGEAIDGAYKAVKDSEDQAKRFQDVDYLEAKGYNPKDIQAYIISGNPKDLVMNKTAWHAVGGSSNAIYSDEGMIKTAPGLGEVGKAGSKGYEFQIHEGRVYRMDKATGEVTPTDFGPSEVEAAKMNAKIGGKTANGKPVVVRKEPIVINGQHYIAGYDSDDNQVTLDVDNNYKGAGKVGANGAAVPLKQVDTNGKEWKMVLNSRGGPIINSKGMGLFEDENGVTEYRNTNPVPAETAGIESASSLNWLDQMDKQGVWDNFGGGIIKNVERGYGDITGNNTTADLQATVSKVNGIIDAIAENRLSVEKATGFTDNQLSAKTHAYGKIDINQSPEKVKETIAGIRDVLSMMYNNSKHLKTSVEESQTGQYPTMKRPNAPEPATVPTTAKQNGSYSHLWNK